MFVWKWLHDKILCLHGIFYIYMTILHDHGFSRTYWAVANLIMADLLDLDMQNYLESGTIAFSE